MFEEDWLLGVKFIAGVILLVFGLNVCPLMYYARSIEMKENGERLCAVLTAFCYYIAAAAAAWFYFIIGLGLLVSEMGIGIKDAVEVTCYGEYVSALLVFAYALYLFCMESLFPYVEGF